MLASSGDVSNETQQPPGCPAIFLSTTSTPPVAVHGKGIYITLKDGRTLIDAAGGAAVACVGNGHPQVVKAIKDQAEKLAYVFHRQFLNAPADELARILVESSNGAFEMVAFVSGGSEAMEAALKAGRQYFLEVGEPQRTHYIGRHSSYHGNTLGALAVAEHPARKEPFRALLPTDSQGTFHHVSPAYYQMGGNSGETEAQYVQRLKDELDAKFQEVGPDSVIGFVAETVVGGAAGSLTPPKGYFKAVKEVCDRYGALLILDEVMCGMGRMGTTHAWESFGDGVRPDLQAVAKGLGAGYGPLGALLMSPKIVKGIQSGSGFLKNGHSYQAHPIACASAVAVQQVIAMEGLLENCRTMGALLSSELRRRLQGQGSSVAPYVFEVRGGGLFWSIDYDIDILADKMRVRFGSDTQFSTLLVARLFENGLVVLSYDGGGDVDGTKGDFILLAPAFNITPEEVNAIVDIIVKTSEDLIGDIIRAGHGESSVPPPGV